MDVAVTSNVSMAVAGLAARAAALRDLRPVLTDVAAEIDRLTAEGFEKSRRVDGLPFADLKDSTLIGRMRRRKGLYKKAAAGTKPRKDATAAERKQLAAQRRSQVLDAAKAMRFKPLIDTGRMRNSARARVSGNNTVRWAIVDYGVAHMTGTKNARPPQRNPSVFRLIYGKWVIDPKAAAFVIGRLSAHISSGGKR